MDTETMLHWLDKQAQLQPQKIAIQTEKENVTYETLQYRSRNFARRLATLGVTKHSRVALLSTNNLEMIETIYALSYLQATIVFLNVRLTKAELMYQVTNAQATLLITTPSLQSEKRLPFSNLKTFTEIAELPPGETPLATHISLSTPFTMMFTSGTTGKPKAVLHTYGNHWWSAISSALNLGIDKEDKWLLTLPIFHVGGLSILMRSVIYGITAFVMERYRKERLMDALKYEQVTIASLVIVMLRDVLTELKEGSLPSHVRCLLLGGSAVPKSLLTIAQEKQIPVIQSYGMTETSSQIVTLPAKDALQKVGSSGKALFPAEVTIHEPNNAGVGEVFVKGPMVINAYENNATANKESFADGWLKTGDIGYVDKEGFLYVMERRSDLIISGGENIYPTEIEHALLAIDKIDEAAVIGKEDDIWGQVPVAFVVMKKSDQITKAELIKTLKQTIASYKIPKEFYTVNALPKNATNKVQRHKLHELLHDTKINERNIVE